MSRRERDKGRVGEAEVAEIFRRHGMTVRGLEGAGDHLIVCGADSGLVLHSEVKRQETTRPWAWFAQATAETPPGAVATVHFRRNRSPWLTMIETERLAQLLARLDQAEAELASLPTRTGRP